MTQQIAIVFGKHKEDDVTDSEKTKNRCVLCEREVYLPKEVQIVKNEPISKKDKLKYKFVGISCFIHLTHDLNHYMLKEITINQFLSKRGNRKND